MKSLKIIAAAAACSTLVACGGGGTSSAGGVMSYESQLTQLQGDLRDSRPTAESKLPTGSATFDGVAAFNLSDASEADFDALSSGNTEDFPGYLGALKVNVNFANDSLSGSVTNFAKYSGTAVGGKLSISNGQLTGTNGAGVGDGLDAVAKGSIDGTSLTMDVTGNFIGANGEGLGLFFERRNALGGGVGLAAR